MQQVKVNNELSNSKAVLSGIPQGSVLGPLLFAIFINDLPLECGDLGNMFLFADDAKIYKHIKSSDDFKALNQCCGQVLAWCENWLMKLNFTKCKVLSICQNKKNIVKFNYGFDLQNQTFASLEHEDSTGY